MSSNVFSLAGLRVALPGGPRLRSGQSPLLGGANADERFSKQSLRRRGTLGRVWSSNRRYFQLLFAVLALVAFFLWRSYEVHVELQFYSKNWVKRKIEPVPPLSGTCFAPAVVARTEFNLTLHQSPNYVDLHAGLGLRLGSDCYHFASTLPSHPLPGMILPERTIFHTYWRSDLAKLAERQIQLLHSLLATQDRHATSVILWTNDDGTTLRNDPLLRPLLATYGGRLEVWPVAKKALAVGTPMESHKLLDLADEKAWLDGDLVRILVLYAHGGVWVDMDTIMTGRDVRVLLESEWVTQWDCYDKLYQPLNGAMMHFLKHSPYLCEMLFAMANDPPPRKGTTDWGSRLYHQVYRRLIASGHKPFKILPYCFTDGRSCRIDNRLPDPFTSLTKKERKGWGTGRAEDLRKKVGMAFAVHLHNQWAKKFPNDGWVNELILAPLAEHKARYESQSLALKEREDDEQ